MTEETKVRVNDLFKIFGRNPAAALLELEKGRSRDEILASTGSVVAVAGVSFVVRPGEVFVVMGLSGSGKSTLVRCINRLIEPTAGGIYVDSEDVIHAGEERLRQLRLTKVAMVFQHFALFPHKTVVENVEFGLKAQGVDRATRRERALAVLEQVGLRAWANKVPASLSGGMQQRVGLARSLAVNPEVLLMDEAFSALDPLIRRDMQDELLRLQRVMKKSIVFITHDLHEALILGDRIAIMRDGRFVQVGTPQQIVAAPADDYVAAFTRDIDRGRVFTVDQVMKPVQDVGQKVDSVAAAIELLHRTGAKHLFVVDPDRHLLGVVSMSRLHEADRSQALGDVMRQEVVAAAPGSHLADIFARCSRDELIAVVDSQGRLVGTVDPMDLFPLMSVGPRSQST
jgi:glycine betaine/proline transport system ATP-binding protein